MPDAIIYQSNRRLILHFVSIICLAVSALVIHIVFFLNKNLQAEFNSLLAYYAWLMFLLIAGNIITLAIIWLSGRYVLKITIGDDNRINITTWSIIGLYQTKTYSATILHKRKYYKGESNNANAPAYMRPGLGL